MNLQIIISSWKVQLVRSFFFRLTFVEVSAEGDSTKEGEKEHKVEPTCSLVLMPGSLLVFKDSAYTGKTQGLFSTSHHKC